MHHQLDWKEPENNLLFGPKIALQRNSTDNKKEANIDLYSNIKVLVYKQLYLATLM